jgi:dGTPase
MDYRVDWNRLLCSRRTRAFEGGRESEHPSSDPRSEFERDLGRATFSPIVRRLQDKAQVFPLERNDAVRTRLTHSQEVAAVAETIAATLGDWLVSENQVSVPQSRQLAPIVRTCGLLHDTGNPPFGHAGESAMQEWFRSRLTAHLSTDSAVLTLADKLGGLDSPDAQDFLRFDGNAQSVRLASHLQTVADSHGLNLTAATLMSLLKYTASSAEAAAEEAKARERKAGRLAYEPRHDHEKPGYFQSEGWLISQLRDVTGTGGSRHPLALVVEAADDIVYSTIDLEDAIRKRVFDWRDMNELLLQAGSDIEQTNATFAGLPQLIASLTGKSESYVNAGDLHLEGHARDIAFVQMFRTYAISDHVYGVSEAFKMLYNRIMAGNFYGELLAESSSSGLWRSCKGVSRHIYSNSETLRLEVMGRTVLHGLMDRFWEAAEAAQPISGGPPVDKEFYRSFAGKLYNLISQNHRRLFERNFGTSARSQTYARLQLVADYVSGMTDTFASELHTGMRER